MNPSDANLSASKLDGIALAVANLRDAVVQEWVATVVKAIPTAATLRKPILTNTLPIFYDDIAETLSVGYARRSATDGNNLGTAHGRERANSSQYTVADVVHELQIFRRVVFNVTRRENLQLDFEHRELINQSIDDAILESLTSFSETHQHLEQMVFASLSHDLRNPLHTASVGAQLIQVKSQDAQITDLARRVFLKIDEADAMMQSLLDTAMFFKREKLQLDIKEFDIKKLADDACADIEMIGRKCEIVGGSVVGYWSRPTLKRALENLLSNAQKFSEPDSVVTIRIATVEGRLLLSVHNIGAPIPEDQISLIFKPFQRRVETSDVTGWGLGLSFVQHVAESHSGTVVVDSAADRGTTFTISIPLDCRPSILKTEENE